MKQRKIIVAELVQVLGMVQGDTVIIVMEEAQVVLALGVVALLGIY
jgi:hypothetical protein